MGDELVARWGFFVSYTRVDRDWAEWVAWQLEEAGHRVLLQVWDMIPGTNWPSMMQNGILYSERTIAIVSSAYLKSIYGQQEWQAAQAADPRGFERKLIPVRVEDCGLPGLLGEIVSFDIFDMDDGQARSHLLDQISTILSGRGKPTEPPPYPGRPAPPTRERSAAFQAPDVARRLGALPDHTGRVGAVAFGCEGAVLATGSADRTVIIWRAAASSRPLRAATLTGYLGPVTGLAFGGPDGSLLAAGSADWTITLSDLSDPDHPRRMSSVRGHRGRVTAVAFAPEGNYLATGGADGLVKLWVTRDPSRPAEVAAVPIHSDDVTSVAFTSDGARMATAGADGAVVLWDVTDPARPRQTAMVDGSGTRVVTAIAADGTRLVVGGRGGIFDVWDLTDPARPARLATYPAHPGEDVTALALSPADASFLASGGSDGLVAVWDLSTAAGPDRAAALNDHRGRIEALAFSPNGRVLATGSADTTVGLWTIG